MINISHLNSFSYINVQNTTLRNISIFQNMPSKKEKRKEKEKKPILGQCDHYLETLESIVKF
jgi:hypothetical protein